MKAIRVKMFPFRFRFQSPRFRLAAAAGAVLLGSVLCSQGQVTATYSPSAWVNDPYTPNPGFTITGASTASPSYVNSADIDYNQNLYGYSPIGATLTLQKPGDTVTLAGTCTLAGDVNYANLQFRFGVLYKGSSANDEGWGGVLIGLPNTGSQNSIYLEKFVSSAIFSTGASANTVGAYGSFTGGTHSGTIAYTLSITYMTPSSTLICWTAQGLNGNAYVYTGRYTNTSPGSIVGTNFDTVGFLKGGSVFSANSTANAITFSNLTVTFGSFGDGTWTNDASGNWSNTNAWVNGNPANGSGFIGNFSQANLSASRTVTLDSSRNIGSLYFGDASGSNNSWTLASSGGSTLSLNNNGLATVPVVSVADTTTLTCPIDSTNGLAMTGAGTLVLAGNNTISGPLDLNGGELSFSSSANLPLSASGITSIVFGGGALQWGPGNTEDISAQGISVSFAGKAGFDTGANNVTLANSFGDGGVGTLTKLGSGTLTFDGGVSYSGGTLVQSGVLALGSSGSIGSTTNIVILTNATLDVSAVSGGLSLGQNLSGAGTVNGSLTAQSGVVLGAGYAATGSAGTLTVNGNLTLSGGGSVLLGLSDLAAPVGGGTNDLIAVGGNLDIAGTTTLSVDLLNGAPGLGTYTVFTYNTFSGSVANLVAPLGYTVVNNTSANAIQLLVTHLPASLTWVGDGSQNIWDVDTTANWLSSGAAAYFLTGDSVKFTDAGSDNPYINIDVPVSPASVTVSNTESYDFAGSGAIITGSLLKTGPGWLVLENNNTYSGPTVISNGLVQVGGSTEGGASGSLGTGPVTNDGVLAFDLSIDYTVTTNIYGTGSITNLGSSGAITLAGNVQGSTMNMEGGGDLILSGSNSYTGQTIVFSGVLHPRSTNALGTGTASLVVSNGAQVYLDANINLGVNKPMQLAGMGPASNGALRKGGSGVSYVGAPITLTADTQFQVDGGATLYLTNAAGITAPATNVILGADANGIGYITGPLNLGPGTLTSQDAGTWWIAPTNNYTGGTLLNGGTLEITAGAALGSTPSFNATFVTFNGGTLGVSSNITFADGLRGFTVSGTGDFDVASGMTLVVSNAITGSGTLTKSDSGTLVLSGANSFNGTFNVDSANNVNNDGVVVVTSSGALANVASPIALRNTLGGASTFEVNGAGGSVVVTQAFTLAGRSPRTPGLLNAAGTNSLSGSLTNTGNGNYIIESDSGWLTLGSEGTTLTCSGTDPETVTLQGNGMIAVLDDIADGTNGGDVAISLAVSGNVTLAAANSYSGTTAVSGGSLLVNGSIGTNTVTVSGGSLGGTGTIGGPVIVGAGGTFAPGAPLGTLTINNTLTLAGNTLVALNGAAKSAVTGLTSVSYGGTLTVTNLGGALNANQSFTLFNASSFSGNFTNILGNAGAGLNFAFNPTNGVLTVLSGLPTTPTNISYSVSLNNSTITLNWPSSYTGWVLQAQTNSSAAGLGTNWVTVSGSGATNQVTLPICVTNPAVFFRLAY